MLESREATKKFNMKTAVDSVTVTLEPGHVYALLGPNGSGKTTWMKMVAALTKPTSGEILFDGQPVGVSTRSVIAYMSTEPYFYSWMTIGDAGKYYSDFFEDFSVQRYEELLEQMELSGSMRIKTLSSGMTAKMKVAVTLARNAKVTLLDEPFNGIDLLARDDIRAAILQAADRDRILVLSSHLVEEMEAICDRAIFLRGGQLVETVDPERLRAEEGLSLADRYRSIYGHAEVDA